MSDLNKLQAQGQAFIQECSEHQAKELLVLLSALGEFIPTIPSDIINPTMEICWFESQGKLYPWGSFGWRKVDGIPITSQDQQRGCSLAAEIIGVEISVECDGSAETYSTIGSIGCASTKYYYFKAGEEWPSNVVDFLDTHFAVNEKED